MDLAGGKMRGHVATYHARPHPWHGLPVGPEPPRVVNAFIEITPFDAVKYELEKETGFMMVARPQITSSLPPSLYGFIPRTLCEARTARLMSDVERGDGDPLDICVLSERPIARGDLLLRARVVGGIPTVDSGQADDKILAVLADDAIWSDASDISDLPQSLVDRLCHYFETYKSKPRRPSSVAVGTPYPARHAYEVITAAQRRTTWSGSPGRVSDVRTASIRSILKPAHRPGSSHTHAPFPAARDFADAIRRETPSPRRAHVVVQGSLTHLGST